VTEQAILQVPLNSTSICWNRHETVFASALASLPTATMSDVITNPTRKAARDMATRSVGYRLAYSTAFLGAKQPRFRLPRRRKIRRAFSDDLVAFA
jgi:hypothetical protein